MPRRGDGICLFYSLFKTDDASVAGGLRQEINDFVVSVSETILGTSTILGPFRLKLVGRRPVFDYTDFMREQTAWGGAIEIALFSRLRNVPVKVFVRASDGQTDLQRYIGMQPLRSACFTMIPTIRPLSPR